MQKCLYACRCVPAEDSTNRANLQAKHYNHIEPLATYLLPSGKESVDGPTGHKLDHVGCKDTAPLWHSIARTAAAVSGSAVSVQSRPSAS